MVEVEALKDKVAGVVVPFVTDVFLVFVEELNSLSFEKYVPVEVIEGILVAVG